MKQREFVVGVAWGLAAGMACGLAVGAVAGVLLAPASGAETRRRLRYERDHAVEVTQKQVRRTMARLRRTQPDAAEIEEEEGAFSGA